MSKSDPDEHAAEPLYPEHNPSMQLTQMSTAGEILDKLEPVF